MIWQAKPGQLVRVHYRESLRSACCRHGQVGVVVRAGRGPGPHNVEVLFPDGERVVYARGNLVTATEAKP